MNHFLDEQCISECWHRIRTRGRRHFIVHYGLRRFALRLGAVTWLILFVIIPVFFEGHATPDLRYLGSRPFWLSLLGAVLLWPPAGYLWGTLEWRRREAEFRRA
jgi:peptidoglycan/LPS O-acetylase OafA/YrhL